jgi:hypothetical protein
VVSDKANRRPKNGCASPVWLTRYRSGCRYPHQCKQVLIPSIERKRHGLLSNIIIIVATHLFSETRKSLMIIEVKRLSAAF